MGVPGAATGPLTSLPLRCQSCGAAYTGSPRGEILTCTYCGTSQRIVDARQFLDHFMAQVTEFVRQAIPVGMDGAGGDRIDPVARLAAFNGGVRPRLATESEQYRFHCFHLLSTGLAVLPFSPTVHPAAGTDPASVSVFAAKVQSVSTLAVDAASRELLARSGGLASAYQSLLVAVRLLGGAQPERFALLQQNFATAARAMESTGKWGPLVTRLVGLAEESRAVDLWLTAGKPQESRAALAAAATRLGEARTQLAASPELGYLLPAVDQELAAVRMIGAMLDIAEQSPQVPPEPRVFVQRLSGVLDWVAQHAPRDWSAAYRSAKLREEVFRRAGQLRAAQAGRGGVRAISVGGGALLPFWVVELPYTFETGMLWAKRGKEVPETLLVAATFPTDLASLAGPGTARVLTDVFSLAPPARAVDAYYNRLRGREQKISESGELRSIVQQGASVALTGRQAVPPFSTETEALRLVQSYLEAIRLSNPKAAAQLRASSPRVSELVYVPCAAAPDVPIPWLGPLSPVSVGDPGSLVGFLGPP